MKWTTMIVSRNQRTVKEHKDYKEMTEYIDKITTAEHKTPKNERKDEIRQILISKG